MDGVNAAQDWHSDINHCDVRAEALYLRYKHSPVACRAYKFKVLPQERFLGFQEFGMVIR
jgi:hypothetical protein